MSKSVREDLTPISLVHLGRGKREKHELQHLFQCLCVCCMPFFCVISMQFPPGLLQYSKRDSNSVQLDYQS